MSAIKKIKIIALGEGNHGHGLYCKGCMGMAYSKAWRILKECEETNGVELVIADGVRGSHVSQVGREWMKAYKRANGWRK